MTFDEPHRGVSGYVMTLPENVHTNVRGTKLLATHCATKEAGTVKPLIAMRMHVFMEVVATDCTGAAAKNVGQCQAECQCTSGP